ncbi:sel1 repeat family protein [Thalassotalea sp. M1531]|uniref:Sel1 repeat family protein n=1 Tax=Thalassotalea algicola TaxID=2716224 RepID=A0A7Y0Q6P0_9GAMM|nr:sel1 repeat family protein [Thalassotalea algicola]NMP31371.1 sel1 repeat family protein [Thalassotalea algicola]
MSSENFKAPSQVFRWFEKMKSNYEHTVNAVLNRFEQYNEKQQARLDEANNQHIENLKVAHQQQLEQSQATIAQLQSDIGYYKQQISQQQNSIEQLNARYDAVMTTFLDQKKRDIEIEAIFADEDDSSPIEFTLPLESVEETELSITETINESTIEIDDELAIKLYKEALQYREQAQLDDAIPLFKQAAKLGCVKSKGALGRAYFLAEGVEEDPSLGLAWLITAAEQGLPQAIKRVEHFQQADPELFSKAEQIKTTL